MVKITNQKDAQKIRNLDFCYLCGKKILNESDRNHDHVPPKSVFKTEDRNFPIKLVTHKLKCHGSLNIEDEVIGQLISLLHGRTAGNFDKLKLKGYTLNGTSDFVVLFDKFKIEILLQRWIRGFYTALYMCALSPETEFSVQPPLPIGDTSNGTLKEVISLDLFSVCEATIKQNIKANNTDSICCNNEKLLFNCVWDKLSDNSWGCIFSLDLYNWSNLGDSKYFQQKECVGLFRRPDGGAPTNAAKVL